MPDSDGVIPTSEASRRHSGDIHLLNARIHSRFSISSIVKRETYVGKRNLNKVAHMEGIAARKGSLPLTVRPHWKIKSKKLQR